MLSHATIIFLLVCVNWTHSTLDYETDSEEMTSTTAIPEPLPYFDDTNLTNLTAQLGSTCFLSCRVNDLQDKTVSWIRKEMGAVRLLTFGLHSYSLDSRLSVNFVQPNNWMLRISSTDKQDQGDYECQVSSHPPIVLHITLTVIVPNLKLVDDLDRTITDKFYNAGSTLELKCIITHLPSHYTILWIQGNKTLNYDTSRGGISVKTSHRPSTSTSSLYITNARKNDSGPYICSLGNLTQGTVYVHVVDTPIPGYSACCYAETLICVQSIIWLGFILCVIQSNLFSPV